MSGFDLISRWNRVNGGSTRPSVADNADLLDANQFFNQVGAISSATGGTGFKIDGGSANFVSGVASVTTKLSTIVAFQVELDATGNFGTTGVGEISNAATSGAITPTGGATVVGVQGYRLNTSTASVSGTGLFRWFALGT